MLSFVIVPKLRAVSLFSWSVEQNARDTQMTTRLTEGARRERHDLFLLGLPRSRARAPPLTKSEEKERLLAGHIVPIWQISFAWELKQRRRQLTETKEFLQIISKYIHVYSFDCCMIKYKWEKIQSLPGKIELQFARKRGNKVRV